MSATIEQGKAMIRAQVAADLAEKLAKLREERPELDLEQAWAALKARERELFVYASQIESDAWPRPEPVFRYVDAKKSTTSWSVKDGLKSFMSSKVEGRKPKDDEDTEVMLVMAEDGAVACLELHKKTQRLLDKTDGPLHRDIARALVLDQNPQLAGDHEDRDKLLAAQGEIKRRIKEMQLRDPKKSFRQCWESLQRSNPELFEALPESA